MSEQKYLVSTSVPDAVDFTAAAILGSLGQNVTAEVDESDKRSNISELLDLDPRLAFPLPGQYRRAPDRSVRQRVISIGSSERCDPSEEFARSELADVLDQLGKIGLSLRLSIQKELGRSEQPANVTIMRCVFSALGSNVQVRHRGSRKLTAGNIVGLESVLRRRLDETGTSEIVFTNGGGFCVANKVFESVYAGGGEIELQTVRPINHRVRMLSLTDEEVHLQGPLDALLPSLAGNILAHVPWFLNCSELTMSSVVAPAVSIVGSLFRKQYSGFDTVDIPKYCLLDEYPVSNLNGYLLGIGVQPSDHLFETLRLISATGVRTTERWAWSQSSARDIRQAVLKSSYPSGSELPVVRTALLLRDAEATARKLFSRGDGSALTQVFELSLRLYAEIAYWSEFLGRVRLRQVEFTGCGTQTIDSIEMRLKERGIRADERTLSDIRFFTRELLDLAISSVMLVGDTSCRASVFLLASLCESKDFAEWAQENRRDFNMRMNSKVSINCL